MGYDKFGLDWSVFGCQQLDNKNAENPILESIGKGWSGKTSNSAPVDEPEQDYCEDTTPQLVKNVCITSAKFISDAEIDFLKECKIQIAAKGDPSIAEASLWSVFNGMDYDLKLSKKVNFSNGIAESTLPL